MSSDDESSMDEGESSSDAFLKDVVFAVSNEASFGSFGDRDGMAESLADAGSLVTVNLNKGWFFFRYHRIRTLVSLSSRAQSSLQQKVSTTL